MIILPDLAIVEMPRTGSTWVRKCLRIEFEDGEVRGPGKVAPAQLAAVLRAAGHEPRHQDQWPTEKINATKTKTS